MGDTREAAPREPEPEPEPEAARGLGLGPGLACGLRAGDDGTGEALGTDLLEPASASTVEVPAAAAGAEFAATSICAKAEVTAATDADGVEELAVGPTFGDAGTACSLVLSLSLSDVLAAERAAAAWVRAALPPAPAPARSAFSAAIAAADVGVSIHEQCYRRLIRATCDFAGDLRAPSSGHVCKRGATSSSTRARRRRVAEGGSCRRGGVQGIVAAPAEGGGVAAPAGGSFGARRSRGSGSS